MELYKWFSKKIMKNNKAPILSTIYKNGLLSSDFCAISNDLFPDKLYQCTRNICPPSLALLSSHGSLHLLSQSSSTLLWSKSPNVVYLLLVLFYLSVVGTPFLKDRPQFIVIFRLFGGNWGGGGLTAGWANCHLILEWSWAGNFLPGWSASRICHASHTSSTFCDWYWRESSLPSLHHQTQDHFISHFPHSSDLPFPILVSSAARTVQKSCWYAMRWCCDWRFVFSVGSGCCVGW